MRDDTGITGPLREFNGGECFRHGAYLIQFNQYAVGNALFNALHKNLRICNKDIVTDNLYFGGALFGKRLPALPIILGKTVFYGDDGIFLNK